MADTMEDRDLQQKEKGTKPMGEGRRMSDYQALVQQDIFRTTRQRPQAEPAPAVEEKPVQVTRLNLKLKGVVMRSGNGSFAAIMDGGTRKEDIYFLNDTIQNAKVAKILRDQVILEVNNRQEALLLFPQTDVTPQGAAVKQAEARKPVRPVAVEGPPRPVPERSALGSGVASRLPAMIRQKRR
jgi:type II secretory pathway component PulC